MDNALTELNEEFSSLATGVRRLLDYFCDASLFNPVIHIVSWEVTAEVALPIDDSNDLAIEGIN